MACASAVLVQPAAAATTPNDIGAKVDPIFAQYVKDMPVPGMAYGVVRDGRLVHFGAKGVQNMTDKRPVDRDSRFRLASMSKAFTALAVLKLRDEGKLRLDDLAETYIPEMRQWRYPTADSPRIRVRDLLAHAGGLVNDDPWADRQGPSDAEFGRMIEAGMRWSRAPGTAMEYSNFGYALLGRIISSASKRPYEEYVEKALLQPLGMTATGYEVREAAGPHRVTGYRFDAQWVEETPLTHRAFGSMGGMWTTAEDYGRWLSFLLSAWPARDGPDHGPVRRSTVREMGQGLNFPSMAQRPRPGSAGPCMMPSAYGMGMVVVVDCELGPLLMHGGGLPGYGLYVMLFPERGTALFAFTNRTYAAPAPALTDAALALDRAGLMPRRPVSVSKPLSGAYQAVTASWLARSIEPARSQLAANFLVDRSAGAWQSELQSLHKSAGACRTDTPIVAESELAGSFRWTCERAQVDGRILLAPTEAPGIQSLHLGTSARP